MSVYRASSPAVALLIAVSFSLFAHGADAARSPSARKKWAQHAIWYSKTASEDISATLEGTRLVLRPSSATFTLPASMIDRESWILRSDRGFTMEEVLAASKGAGKDSWYVRETLHLTRAELDAVARGYGEWDTEYASVANAVLPFDRCAAHIGEEAWGERAVSYGDLQMRIYDLAEHPAAVENRIESKGIAEVKRLGAVPKLKHGPELPWRQTLITFPLSYGDYGGLAHVDFRIRRRKNRTFVIVFMYSDSKQTELKINSILDSFSSS